MRSCFEADIADDGGVPVRRVIRTGGIFLQSRRGGHWQLRPRKRVMNHRRMTTRRAEEVETAKRDSEGRVGRPQRWKQVREGRIDKARRVADVERHLSTGSVRIRSHVQRCKLTGNKYRFASCSWRKSLLHAVLCKVMFGSEPPSLNWGPRDYLGYKSCALQIFWLTNWLTDLLESE